jgi:hypothetical protein
MEAGKLNNVPELPKHFIPRKDSFDAVKSSLLAGANNSNNAAVAAASCGVGVYGMGGIGKSVLAAAVARDEKIRSAFTDGIYWISIGQMDKKEKAALMLRQSQLANAVLGENSPVIRDVQVGRSVLSNALSEKACLVILDDIWHAEHIHPFNVLGSQCRMIVTTRDVRTITGLNVVAHRLDVLNEDQSLELLCEWTEVEQLPHEASEIARECDNLPLALAIIGAMLKGTPDRWPDVLHRFRSANLEKIAHLLPNYQYRSLFLAMQASMEALDKRKRARYCDFAVFPEDTLIPEAALKTFWSVNGIDEFEAEDFIDEFVALSLMALDEKKRLTLHDLQFDYVRKQAGDLKLLHNRLLDAYAKRSSDCWAKVPNDGYYFEHLAYHLKEAGREDELKTLLLDYRWIKSKLENTDAIELLQDYRYSEDADTQAVKRTLMLSSHVLTKNKDQLKSQLWGRLAGNGSPNIERLLQQTMEEKGNLRLLPISRSLMLPDSPLLFTLEGHSASVNAVSICPEGKTAVSGSDDNTLKVWDLKSGELKATLEGHSASVNAVSICGDGKRAVTSSLDNTLKVWDLESGKTIAEFTADNSILCCAVAWLDKPIIAAGDTLGIVHFLRLEE